MSDILDFIDNDDLEELEDLDEDFESSDELEFLELEDYEMTLNEAQEITQAIKSSVTATYILISEAHAKKAYKALGYSNWADYVKEEFDITASRSYQLLDLSKTIKEIESASPEGTVIKLTEAQARDIKRELPKITERISEETRGLEPEEASEAVDRIVDEIREQQKLEAKAIAEKEKKLEEAEQDGYHKGLEAAADAMLAQADEAGTLTDNADNEFVEYEVNGESRSLSPEDSMNLYNFFNVLTSISSLPEPDDFVNTIPDERSEEIENQLIEATSWLNRFQTLWEIRKDQ